MRRTAAHALLFALALSVLVPACSTSRIGEQLKFGIWASEKNLWDEAIFRWKKAVAEDPKSVAAHNNLAVAYEKKRLFDEAIKEYELALKLDPGNARVKSNYQNCKENIQPPGKTDKAKDEKK